MKKPRVSNRLVNNKPKKKKKMNGNKSFKDTHVVNRDMSTIGIIDFAKEMYKKYGKGLVMIHPSGIGYVLPSNTAITEIDKAMMDSLNHENEFVITVLEKTGAAETSILNEKSPYFKRKFRINHDWAERLEELVYQ